MATGKRGRPMKYQTAEELQAAVDAYFDGCRGHYRRDDSGAYVLDRNGRPILDGAVPLTMTGLQLALGFRSRQSLCDYRGRRAFRDVIERARLRVENYTEERLFDRDGFSGAAWLLTTAFSWGREAAPDAVPVPGVRIVVMDV